VKQSRLERAEEHVTRWKAELAQVERERRGMVWALYIGVPLGGVVAATANGWVGAGIVGIAIVTWLLGLYMTTVRRAEFAQHVREAERELAAARGVS
jgi:hypothetical protein